MLRMLWDEVVFAAEDLGYYLQRKIGPRWNSLTYAFEDKARDVRMAFEDLRWDITDRAEDAKERLSARWNGTETDGAIKLADGVFLYKPEPAPPEPQAKKFSTEKAIDAEFTDIPRP
ncbi:MAG: hypothetical protein GC204_09390 [Chloroflexi bacterium]|nr:hypothetical protein [Chloroflexota bacterium]